MTGSSVEERYQELGVGMSLLNLLFVVDELLRDTSPTAQRRQDLQMFLLRSAVYSKREVAKDAYEDLLSFLKDVTPPEGPEVVVELALEVDNPEGRGLLQLLRTVLAQKLAASQGRSLKHTFPDIEDPARATRALVEALLAKLT